MSAGVVWLLELANEMPLLAMVVLSVFVMLPMGAVKNRYSAPCAESVKVSRAYTSMLVAAGPEGKSVVH